MFYFYSGVSLLCLLLTYLFVPEVKGLSLEDVAGVFESMTAKKTCVPCLRVTKHATYYGVVRDVEGDVNGDPESRHLKQGKHEPTQYGTFGHLSAKIE